MAAGTYMRVCVCARREPVIFAGAGSLATDNFAKLRTAVAKYTHTHRREVKKRARVAYSFARVVIHYINVASFFPT